MATTSIREPLSHCLTRCYPLQNIRQCRYVSKAVYTLLGLNLQGKKEILGIHLSESEGANYWLTVLTELQNRGVKDILIACIDGLTGFPEAIATVLS